MKRLRATGILKKTRGIAVVAGLLVVALTSCAVQGASQNTPGTEIRQYDPNDPPEAGGSVYAQVPKTAPELPAGTRVIAFASARDQKEQLEIIRTELQKIKGIQLDWRLIPEGADSFDAVGKGYRESPQLIIGVGPSLESAFDLISATYLKVRTITLGMQIGEPTTNVDAVIWPGASDRAAQAHQNPNFTGAEKWAKDAVAVAIDAYLSDRRNLVYVLGKK